MLTLPRHLVAATLCALGCLLLSPSAAGAQEGFAGLCSLFMQQTQAELEDLDLAVQQNETRFEVAEEIFVLVDDMWRNDLVERLPYLAVKHRRDVAEVSLEQARRRRDRQRAVVDQYGLACSASPRGQQAPDDPGTIEEAHQRYLDADCELRALDVAVSEIDLEYHQEILESAIDLRQNDIASRQQVLYAERDVQLTLNELELALQRAARCRQ